MNGGQAIWFLLTVATAALVGACILFVIPWCLRSVLAYRFWRLRDAITDGVANKTLPSESAALLVKRIDFTIRHSRELTAFHMFVIHWTAPKGHHDNDMEIGEPALDDYEKEWQRAVLNYVLLGSPSGWVLCIAVAMAALVTLPFRHEQPRQVLEEQLRDDLAVAAEKGPWLSRRDRKRALSAYV